MIRLIHAADFHLDAACSALSPERSQARRGELRALPGRLAELAADFAADLLLLAGDLFDGEETYYETTRALARALGELKTQVFIAPGNHDFYSARSPYATLAWPENVHIFTQSGIEAVELPALNCVVYGAAFTGPLRDDAPLAAFSAPQDGRTHLMVLHGDVDGRGQYCNLSRADIAASGLDYLALGHIHACSGVQRAGATAWAYPGCPEGHGFDELGDKGVLCGTIDGAAVALDFIPLCKRRYEIKTIELGDADPRQTLAAALPAAPTEDICRILLAGERGAEALDLAALEAIAAPYYYSVSLRDRTRVRRALWSRAGEDTLTGLFLRELQQAQLEAADDAQRERVERAARFGLAALENREDCCP